MTDRQAVKACCIFAAAVVVLGCILHLCCSPVSVQVQQCTNEVRDSTGYTFTGCRSDSDQKTDGEGTLRVEIPAKKAPEDSSGVQLGIPTDRFGQVDRRPNKVREN